MTEIVTLETSDGKTMGQADVFASADHYPDRILVMMKHGPQVFQLDRVSNGHLFYRYEYVERAANFIGAQEKSWDSLALRS